MYNFCSSSVSYRCKKMSGDRQSTLTFIAPTKVNLTSVKYVFDVLLITLLLHISSIWYLVEFIRKIE